MNNNPMMDRFMEKLQDDPILSLPDEEFKRYILSNYTLKDRMIDGYYNLAFGKWSGRFLKAVLAPVLFLAFTALVTGLLYCMTITFPSMGVDVYGTPHPVGDMGFLKTVSVFHGQAMAWLGMVYAKAFGELNTFQKTMAFLWIYFLTTGITIFFWNNVEKKGLARGLVFPLLKFFLVLTVIGAIFLVMAGLNQMSRRRL